jgi:drug/metabolite transporter (DMT)-like permease
MNKNTLIAVAMMIAAMLLLPTGDGVGKYLGSVTLYSAGFLAWSRYIVGLATVTPIALANGAFSGLGRDFVIRQAIRGFFNAGAIFCILKAVKTVPLADSYGAFFIAPVVATLLAFFVLKEKVRLVEWVAVILGFVGVLLVVQPSGQLSTGLIWALASGTCFACFMISTRWSAGTAPPLAQLFGQLFFGFLFTIPLGLSDLLAHGIVLPAIVIAMGLISALANLLQILAFAQARAAFLAPFVYSQIIAATSISWFFFGDQLNGLAMIGLAIIFSTGFLKIQPRSRPSGPA